jgi:hypothetical protein
MAAMATTKLIPISSSGIGGLLVRLLCALRCSAPLSRMRQPLSFGLASTPIPKLSDLPKLKEPEPISHGSATVDPNG